MDAVDKGTTLGFLILAAINAPWFTFVIVALAGGMAAHAHWYETHDEPFALTKHFNKFMTRCVISVFIGMMVYYGADGMGFIGSPWARLAGGLGGFFGVKALDVMLAIGSAWLAKLAGVAPPRIAPTPDHVRDQANPEQDRANNRLDNPSDGDPWKGVK